MVDEGSGSLFGFDPRVMTVLKVTVVVREGDKRSRKFGGSGGSGGSGGIERRFVSDSRSSQVDESLNGFGDFD